MDSHTPTEEHAEDVLRIHRVEISVGITVGRLGALTEHIVAGIALQVIPDTVCKLDERHNRAASAHRSMCCRPLPRA